MIPIYYVISNELYHHGIKGQKWGVRRFQNEDGSLTAKGEKRYNRNKKHIEQEIAIHENQIKQERSQARLYTKSANDIKKTGKTTLDAEYGNSLSESEKAKTLRITAGRREYNAAALKAAAKGREWYINELKKLDVSTMSSMKLNVRMAQLAHEGQQHAKKYFEDSIAKNQNISEYTDYTSTHVYPYP